MIENDDSPLLLVTVNLTRDTAETLHEVEVAAWVDRDMSMGHVAHVAARSRLLPDGHIAATVVCEDATELSPSEVERVQQALRLESLKLAHRLLESSKGALS